MSWFKRSKSNIEGSTSKREVADGSWVKCDHCGEMMHRKQLASALFTCIHCEASFRVSAGQYIDLLLDEGSFRESDRKMRSTDPLKFRDSKAYADRIEATVRGTGMFDAMRSGMGKIQDIPVSIAVMDFGFIGGSMGSVVGEKIARAVDRAVKHRCALIIVSASGGARMMEGALSLMQMAKTSARLTTLHEAGLPYISIMLDPTTGGVTASFAMLGDVNIAEPKALIGFAGPRVIKQTIGRDLPEGFQRAEFLLEKGFLDLVIPRKDMRDTLGKLLRHMGTN
ncbi:MAG: acetyl-CoA carboxylase, carboxyltransferase subunit beta [Bacteroidota bacterium]|jgi:acetyl-CoA carboxylase carboxyl transferase subunit beta|nr:acetyl-CoA carboxylase, carboxyltransferase subunit beta [Bacteroidota bacterium]